VNKVIKYLLVSSAITAGTATIGNFATDMMAKKAYQTRLIEEEKIWEDNSAEKAYMTEQIILSSLQDKSSLIEMEELVNQYGTRCYNVSLYNDAEKRFMNNNDTRNETLDNQINSFIQDLKSSNTAEYQVFKYTFQDQNYSAIIKQIANTPNYAVITTSESDLMVGNPKKDWTGVVIMSLVGLLMGTGYAISQEVKKKINKGVEFSKALRGEAENFFEEMADGKRHYRVDVESFSKLNFSSLGSTFQEGILLLERANKLATFIESTYDHDQEIILKYNASESEREAIEQLKIDAENMVTELQSNKEEMENMLLENSRKSEEIALAHNQLTESYSKAEEGFSEITSATDELSATTEELSATFSSTAHQILTITQNINAIVDVYSRLEDNLQGITSFVAQQNDISERLNVLTINGSIEASHAGHYGSGFKVVVNEMRKLNEESENYSKKMTGIINNIFQGIPILKGKIESIVQEATLLNQSTEEQKAATNEMVSGVNEISYQTRELDQFIKANKEEMKKETD